MTPSVSIGLITYNGGRYIRATLDSLLTQTHSDFELIISDNASTDNTAGICREYAARDPRIVYHRQPHNIGVFPNAEFVIRQAKGKYFMVVGDDDVYEKEYIAVLLGLYALHPEIGCTYSNYGWIGTDGRRRSSELRIFMHHDDSPYHNLKDFIRTRIVLPMMIGLHRTELFQNALPFPDFGTMTGGIDFAFLMRILPSIRVESTERVLFHYREKDRSEATPASWRESLIKLKYEVIKLNFNILWEHQFRNIRNSRLPSSQKVQLCLYAVYIFFAQYTLYPLVYSVRAITMNHETAH